MQSTVRCWQGHAGDKGGQGSIKQKQIPMRMGLGIAAGSRAHLEATALSQRSWSRNLLMHGFHLLVLLVAGGAIKDTQCGFKVSLSGLCTPQSSCCSTVSVRQMPEVMNLTLGFFPGVSKQDHMQKQHLPEVISFIQFCFKQRKHPTTTLCAALHSAGSTAVIQQSALTAVVL